LPSTAHPSIRVTRCLARYAAKRLAKEVAVEIAAASSDPETDEIAGDVTKASVHEISDAHINALILAGLKHLTP
jgi:hypothetical protein